MFVPLVILINLSSVALAAWAVVFAVRDRAVVLRQLWAAAGVEVLVLLQCALAAIAWANGAEPSSWGLWWSYALTAVCILPVAALWAFAERTRWSSVVLVAAAITVVFMEIRLWQIWGV